MLSLRWNRIVGLLFAAVITVVAAQGGGVGEQECDNDSSGLLVTNLPSPDVVGVDNDLLQLCATISGATYEGASKSDFTNILLENDAIKNAYPDLVVRFYQNGLTLGRNGLFGSFSLNAPSFAAVTMGDTLILAWRGSVTIKDFIADASIASVSPWKNSLPGLEVQKAYFDLMKMYFKYHYKDIINYVNGSYSQVPNKTAKDGTKIKRIILTGHSLGGGIAQVAHLCLTSQIRFLWKDMVPQIKANDVVVKTISISSPMTTVVTQDASPKTLDFLKNEISGNMCNILYKADIVPRGYSQVDFIQEFAQAFGKDLSAATGAAAAVAAAFVNFANSMVDENKNGKIITQASKYRHVGKLVYYSANDATPEVYVNNISQADGTPASDEFPDFSSLQYDGPPSDVADYALENHMFLVTGPGLCFA